jgi:hypothetical protein
MRTDSDGYGAAPANYLGGDPRLPAAVQGGQLAVDEGGLRFVGPEGRELRVPTDSVLGMSISGRAAERTRGRKGIQGTMRVAGISAGEPAELVFAVDRAAAARLQAQLNDELAARGRPSLPHIEELVEFPAGRNPALGTAQTAALPPQASGSHPSLAAAELGHRLDGAQGPPKRKRRVLPWVVLGALFLAAEIAIPIILTQGG